MNYRKVDFDTIAPLMPFDKTASMVASKGESFEWTPTNWQKVHSKDPLPMRSPKFHEARQPGYVDLTGKKAGRLTVMGIHDRPSAKGQNWVVRCVCGAYETRKAKTIKCYVAGTSPDPEPMCEYCNYTQRLQKGYHNPKKAAAAAQAIQEAAQ